MTRLFNAGDGNKYAVILFKEYRDSIPHISFTNIEICTDLITCTKSNNDLIYTGSNNQIYQIDYNSYNTLFETPSVDIQGIDIYFLIDELLLDMCTVKHTYFSNNKRIIQQIDNRIKIIRDKLKNKFGLDLIEKKINSSTHGEYNTLKVKYN